MLTAQKSAGWSILLLLVYTSWARSGVYGPWHAPLWGLFAVVLLCCGILVFKGSSSDRRRLWHDPLLYIGLLLTTFLLIQWRNAGGTLFLDIFSGQYGYTPPPLKGWPFSIDAFLSRQQLAWFIPAWIMLLAVRHLFSRSTLKWLLWGMLYNGALMALFGLVQYALGWTKMFGFVEIQGNPHLIASFDYPNHGGSFFYLLYALAIGLMIDAIEKRKSVLRVVLPAGLSLLFAITSLASLSRAAVLAVVGITLAGLLVWIILHHRNFTTTGWVNLSIFSGVAVVLFVFGLLSMGDGDVMREFKGGFTEGEEQTLSEAYVEGRGYQIPPALEMVKDYPLFGVGGWGYRRFLKIYLSEEEWQHYLATGKANVHCDPVQFLAEHGVVGFGLMTAGLGIIMAPWFRFRKWRFKGAPAMLLVGAGMVMVHSLIDLPFRCPTVLWYWLILLAILPLLSQDIVGLDADKKRRGNE